MRPVTLVLRKAWKAVRESWF